MRECGYVLLAVMVFVTILSLSLLVVLSSLFNDKALLREELVHARADAVVFKNLKNIEENRGMLAGCSVAMRSPYRFLEAGDAWWRENACLLQPGLLSVLAQGVIDAHRYVMVSGHPMRAQHVAVVLNVSGMMWLALWLVASDEAAVIDGNSVLSLVHREQLECLQG